MFLKCTKTIILEQKYSYFKQILRFQEQICKSQKQLKNEYHNN